MNIKKKIDTHWPLGKFQASPFYSASSLSIDANLLIFFPSSSAPTQYSFHFSGRQANSSHLYVLNSLSCSVRPPPQSQHTACHLAGSNPGTRPPAEVRPAGARSPDRMKGNSLLSWEQLRQREHWYSCRPAPAPALRNVEPLKYAMQWRAHMRMRTNTQGHTSAR